MRRRNREKVKSMVDEKLVKLITERVIEKIREYQTYKIPIGVSNRHVHVTKEDLEILFSFLPEKAAVRRNLL